MITLITMSQGNPLALKRTLDSFAGLCNEVVFGDLLLLPSDRAVIETYGVNMVPLPFNYIYKNGFAATLNELSKHATNDWCLYMNVGEVIDGDTITMPKAAPNCYCFDHANDPHKWFRLYDRRELQWNGLIHEELVGIGSSWKRGWDEPIFRMADTDKDEVNATLYNDVKEIVYFQQYLRLVDEPGIIGITNRGWVDYAKRDYNYIKERMLAKGRRVEAFETGDLSLYLNEAINQEFLSNNIIHFQ